MQECREEEAYESECNAGVRTYPYRDFRQTKCRKIKPDQCTDRTESGNRIRCTRNHDRSDDEGELGKLRVKKSYQVLNKTDIVLLVCSAAEGITEEEQKLLKQIEKKQIPCILVMNKADLLEECQKGQREQKMLHL